MSFHWLKKQAKEPVSSSRLPIKIITGNPLSGESCITKAVMGQTEEQVSGQKKARAEHLDANTLIDLSGLLDIDSKPQNTERSNTFSLWGNKIPG